jgi:hypothetical protein
LFSPGRQPGAGLAAEDVMKVDWLPEAILAAAFLIALVVQAVAASH